MTKILFNTFEANVDTPLAFKVTKIFIFREQMNFGTAYLDGSGIYGATPESAEKLREFDGGFLKVIKFS